MANYGKRLVANGDGPEPVARKQANAWGLYDMLGLAWQWVGDWFGDSYYRQAAGQDPLGPPTGQMRGIRGGSWATIPRFVRASTRGLYPPEAKLFDYAVRCVGD